MYDMVIIGSGAAGLSAALYAGRARLNVLVIEKMGMTGSQIIYTDKVDNYLGFPLLSGYELINKFRGHVGDLAEFISGEVVLVSKKGDTFKVQLKDDKSKDKREIKAKTVIVATGATHKKLKVQGEERLIGKGVSYCATCDGAFYKSKDVVVAGGGDTALSEALYLSNICNKVYLVHRRGELRGSRTYQDKIFATENIEFVGNAVIGSIMGEERVEGIEYHDKVSGCQKSIEADGVFVAVGMQPETDFIKEIAELDEYGYIEAGEDCITNVRGLFAAGDVRKKPLRQLACAVSDGAVSVKAAEDYISRNIL